MPFVYDPSLRAPYSLHAKLRKLVAIRDEGTCRYCGKTPKTFHLDHVIPAISGGRTSLDNLVVSCPRCNSTKHNKRLPPDQEARLLSLISLDDT